MVHIMNTVKIMMCTDTFASKCTDKQKKAKKQHMIVGENFA